MDIRVLAPDTDCLGSVRDSLDNSTESGMDAPAETTYSLLSSMRYDEALLNLCRNSSANDGQASPFMLLPFHFDRLMTAVGEHGWHCAGDKISRRAVQATCEAAVRDARETHPSGPLKVRYRYWPAAQSVERVTCLNKVRVLISSDGTLSASASPAAPLPTTDPLSIPDVPSEPQRIIYVDTKPTLPSLFTRTKTTRRAMYIASRERVGLAPLPQPTDAHMDVLLYTPEGLVTETSIRNIAFRRGDKWVTPRTQSGCLPGVVRRLMLEEGLLIEGDIRKEELVRDEIVLTMNGVEGCSLGRLAFLSDTETHSA